MKTFSVIIPSYNSKTYIYETIQSIVNTDYDKEKIEVIIVDDGSTDASYEYINEIIQPYPYIRQIKKTNSNWGGVINYVKNNQLAKNEIISILDSDDRYLKHVFKLVSSSINDNDVCAGSFNLFDGKKIKKKVLPYWFLFKRIITDKKKMNTPYCLPLPFFVKKDVFYKLKDLREKVAFQDPDFFSQIIKNANSLIFTKKSIGLYYFNRSNNSRSIDWNEQRFEHELYACYKLIDNDACECVSYRLNVKPFYEQVKTNKIIFKINRKMHFKWFPWYIRWCYFLIYFFKHKKYFNVIK